MALAPCNVSNQLQWWERLTKTGEKWQLMSLDSPNACLDTEPLNGTSEFEQATISECDGSGTAAMNASTYWEYANAHYLNMSFGQLQNSKSGCSLDAAARNSINIFAGPLRDGKWAAVLLNRGNSSVPITLDFSEVHPSLKSTALMVEDVWTGSKMGMAKGQWVADSVEPNDSVFVILTPQNATHDSRLTR